MNIGIITDWMDTGAGMVSRQYVESLKNDHSVFVFARPLSSFNKNDPYWNQPNVTWSDIQEIPQKLPKKQFLTWLRKSHIEIVIFNEQRRWDAVCWAKDAGVITGAYVDYYTQKSVPLFALYDFLICNTQRHYSVFNWHNQAIYLPWGTDTNLFAPHSDAQTSGNIRFFMNAGFDGRPDGWGNAHNRRGGDIALQAFSKVHGNASLIIHSQMPLNCCAQYWQNIVKNDERIIWINQTVRPPGLYHQGNVYLYPSKLDGIGLTLPEALSCGLASITTDVAPMNEFVKEGINGRLIPAMLYKGRADGYYWAEAYCREDSLVNIMQEYVNNPDLVQQHSKKARQLALTHLDWRKNSASLSTKLCEITKVYRGDQDHALRKAARAQDRESYPTSTELLMRACKRKVNLLTSSNNSHTKHS